VLALEVENKERHGRYGEESQQYGGKPSLKFAVHGLGWWRGGAARDSTPFWHEQLHCHPPILSSVYKSLP